MDHPDDVARCGRCGRWQRRRHAYAEEFGPGDREEWCVTGGCFATWRSGVMLVLSAEHDGDGGRCRCGSCRAVVGDPPTSDLVEWAADHGFVGDLDDREDRSA